ncbi:hypothetical protein CVT26_010472 [Gymnopilus dilepis]|uniref:F-box domain-containing protein n=1 Tax=Gymnopilus dilepis TaxID=231916 RepID=A0A409Y0C2_9AGAR|nr:hypothetical protein CVT26_010472 [Gymnopilus dilepis]
MSSACKSRTPYRQGDSLPSELLYEIFDHAHRDNQVECFVSGCDTCLSAWDKELEPKLHRWATLDAAKDNDPNLIFPFNIARVSRQWKSVIASIPEYWTRLVIPIDVDPENYLSYLKFSRNMEVDVMVTRKTSEVEMPKDSLEATRVARVFSELVPHLPRIKVLNVRTLHSDSLPSIRSISSVPGAKPLTELELFSILDDNLEDWIDEDDTAKEISHLRQLTVDSPELINLGLNGHLTRVLWRATFANENFNPLSNIKYLKISNLISEAETSGEFVGLLGMLWLFQGSFMPNLEVLALSNISFDEDEEAIYFPRFQMSISCLFLEGMGNDANRALGVLLDIHNDRTVCPQLHQILLTDSSGKTSPADLRE